MSRADRKRKRASAVQGRLRRRRSSTTAQPPWIDLPGHRGAAALDCGSLLPLSVERPQFRLLPGFGGAMEASDWSRWIESGSELPQSKDACGVGDAGVGYSRFGLGQPQAKVRRVNGKGKRPCAKGQGRSSNCESVKCEGRGAKCEGGRAYRRQFGSHFVVSPSQVLLVGAEGFEPPTSRSQSRIAPKPGKPTFCGPFRFNELRPAC